MGNRASYELTRNFKNLSLMDIVVLLGNLHKGNADNEVGFEDALRTVDDVTRYLQKFAKIDASLIESMIWSCTMLQEKGKFWHPQNRSYEDFIKTIEKSMGEKVNVKYNYLKD